MQHIIAHAVYDWWRNGVFVITICMFMMFCLHRIHVWYLQRSEEIIRILELEL